MNIHSIESTDLKVRYEEKINGPTKGQVCIIWDEHDTLNKRLRVSNGKGEFFSDGLSTFESNIFDNVIPLQMWIEVAT